ncbi:metal-sensitive transcriptional regulator [Candidatus Aminicenantes bacterium AC-335-A11]|jgi:DNA-binding FrmR family transcriptional regulator|nr:metal-sensitive transcriptional regulator [SCandidatus Aminicenantes bacterium Aminicenantia_JdfR_composite]MCP2596979.1 metal-sensitive transcriptional regulator [Candidatus Aminicenantes bacterium AC-335-G13]MCP2605929.1 metal-sensitive transcriptional regulator [Candidatus Aminicenantes bacterium AC-708-I09]MCP2618268.1 metal-sensitive transcriptional regulator [Candidatus Aminicenantes bacterium AC-335-A11]
MKKHNTTHFEELPRLKKIEGQIRGIQRMIEEERYCIDILIQLSAVRGAIQKVEENILEKHLKGCVYESFLGRDQEDKDKKIEEIIGILRKFRK